MIFKTYDEWKTSGFGVIKGQHACLKKDGKCYFNEKQVINLQEYYKQQMISENARMIDSFIND